MIDPRNPDYTNSPVSGRRPQFNYSLADTAAHPYVTIITPFYNTGPVFHETARSVFQQSFQQWEWLIVNDSSMNPEALSVLDAYRGRDPRIRIIDLPVNQGPSAARNTAFREARTQYIVQLDSDNLLEPTAIEKWRWFLESYPEYSFVKGWSVGFGAETYLWQRGFHNGGVFLDENLVDITGMIRKTAHEAAGGYDEEIRKGLEDWDFWLRCASFGYWGDTVPEYLDWYRRRPSHSDRWDNWDNADAQRAFKRKLRQRYPQLWNGGFPQIQPRWHESNDTVSDVLSFENRLRKDKPRLLMVVPWLAMGGADKFNLDLLNLLTQQGWEVTIAATLKGDYSWFPNFARHTPDIFILHHFLRLVDYPRFLRYLIQSRQIDVVMITHSELGYLLLPYLRAHFPETTFVDYCHIEEVYWKNGGHARMAVEYQESLDLNIVTSEHLKRWMVQQGADSQRINVCYINIDAEEWQPDSVLRDTVRQELSIENAVPVILYAGRICPQKQPRVFAKTMLQLKQQGAHFVALAAGGGADLEWLHSFITEHKLEEQVRLLGAVSSERMKQLMVAADIFFLPSQWEGIALSIYEAMACSLPVVSADVGGQRELVTPETGVLITRSDEQTEAQQYADVLAELLQNPQRRKEMGQAGRMRVSTHFRLDEMGKRMVALFEQAMNLNATQPRPRPSVGLGHTCAFQAIESVRLSQLADQLWAERYSTKPNSNLDWRARLYMRLSRSFEPYYHWGVDRGWTWIPPLAERIKKTLLLPK